MNPFLLVLQGLGQLPLVVKLLDLLKLLSSSPVLDAKDILRAALQIIPEDVLPPKVLEEYLESLERLIAAGVSAERMHVEVDKVVADIVERYTGWRRA